FGSLETTKFAVEMPQPYPPTGLMKVTGHWVRTPRSNTITGSFWQAASTAGVSAAVVFGDTIRMSQLPLETSELMSEICLSSLPCASATVNDLMSDFSTST